MAMRLEPCSDSIEAVKEALWWGSGESSVSSVSEADLTDSLSARVGVGMRVVCSVGAGEEYLGGEEDHVKPKGDAHGKLL